jgi:hypothetical protein
MSVILSFDVGVIHLSYCLLTKKEFTKPDGTKYNDWSIIDWNNINLSTIDEEKCSCGAKAKKMNTDNSEIKYYCNKHAKKLEPIKKFEELFTTSESNVCNYEFKNDRKCKVKSSMTYCTTTYCATHSKQMYKTLCNTTKLKPYKMKSSTTLNFDDVKYNLMMELEKRKNLLSADYVVIENQPSFKNPRMKSIASTIYDYYLMRGVIDREITKSNIKYVKFMSPSNKLKIASEGDTKELVLAKKEDGNAYKLTKALGIKYCTELINHLPDKIIFFNSFKKKDDLADSFLQGAYFYTRNIKN